MVSKIRSILFSFIIVGIILTVAAAIIAYGRGYRFDFTKQSLKSTGLVVVSSEPSGAQIVIDGKVKGATAGNLTLAPGWYTLSVSKESFQPWTKRIKVQGEVVTKIDALLLPTNPSLTPLTTTGVLSPTLSPDGSKLAYIIPDQKESKAGIWVLDLVNKPLGLNRDARQIAQGNFTRVALSWSPDSKQLLAGNSLLEADILNEIPQSITIKTVQNDWKAIKMQREKEQLTAYPKTFIDFATSSANIVSFAPDETKVLYEATRSATLPPILLPPLLGANSTEEVRQIKPKNLYVYDMKEDKNYGLSDSGNLMWLPSSRHFIFTTKDKIEIIDYDGTNRRTAYAGPFWDAFAVPWASGGKLVILTNLNPTVSSTNNLYVVNLR